MVFKINRLNRPDNIGIGAVYSVGLFFVTLAVTAMQFVILERRCTMPADVAQVAEVPAAGGARRAGRAGAAT